jgi:glyoxylase-like metal-dependent hydrolase (beta-lactamase superfamily II)
MIDTACRARRRIALGLLLAPLAPAASAQQPSAAASAGSTPSEEMLVSDLLKTGLYLIRGGGCNSLLRLSAAGTILVDGKRPGTYRALMSQVRRINKLSDLPLRVVIVTNHHDIHTGNQARFVDAGVAVLAQANALRRLPAPADPPPAGASAPSARKAPGPVLGVERSHEWRVGGVDVRLHHFGRAQTDNDLVVLFPDLRVLAVGELAGPGAPVPDFAGGGSLAGWGPVLEEVLKLDFDVAVPSTGAPLTRAELAGFKVRLDTLTARSAALVEAGMPKDRFLAALVTDDLGWKLHLDDEQIDRLYADLARTR